MSNRMTSGVAGGLLLMTLFGQGCANVVPGSMNNEIIAGTPVIERGETRRTIVISRSSEDALSASPTIIVDPVFAVSAVVTEPATVTTPQVQRSTREVAPYQGLTELWEWPIMTAFGWVPLLEGSLGFGNYIDGVNPFMNQLDSHGTRETETLSEVAMRPRVEQKDQSDRVGGARIAIGFPGMPRVEMISKEEGALIVPLERLMTRPLSSAPRVVEGVAQFKGSNETVKVRAEIGPDLSNRLLGASRSLAAMDASNPAAVARTALEIDRLGFSTRARSVERAGAKRHGDSVLARAMADTHMNEARAALQRNDHDAARGAIKLARARVARGPKAWDMLEADLHEATGLRAIDENDYKRARGELLSASRLDSTRQARLSGFIAIAIEAMDRKTVREENASRAAAAPRSAPAKAAASSGVQTNAVSNVLEQCLAREAALQACRLMPGFGKDICKSGVRAKYASYTCP